MPFFALLSADVVLGVDGLSDPVAVGVGVGLVLGKPAGVLLGAWPVTRFSPAEINDGLGWRDIAAVAVLSGVGFTVSLLVADLSFADARREDAKTAVLAASLVAALLAAVLLGRRDRAHRTA